MTGRPEGRPLPKDTQDTKNTQRPKVSASSVSSVVKLVRTQSINPRNASTSRQILGKLSIN